MTPSTDHVESRIRGLRHRAASLRSQAKVLTPVLGDTYRRRAQELELEAFVLEQRDDARRAIVGV
jgi:hypothetical protein